MRCIAKKHKSHDYQELDVLSKKDIEKALQEVRARREACGASEKALHGQKVELVGAI